MTLAHEDAPTTRLTVATAEPGRDERLWQEQLRLRLEAFTDLPPVTELRVEADRFVTPSTGQGSLFEDDRSRERNEQALCQRLRARLGDAAVGRLHRVAGLVPPRASRLLPLDAEGRGAPSERCPTERFRPLWWLPAARRPEAAVGRCAEIERVETDWWTAAEEAADYCAGELVSGRSVCLRRERRDGEWRLIGLDG